MLQTINLIKHLNATVHANDCINESQTSKNKVKWDTWQNLSGPDYDQQKIKKRVIY